MVYKMKVAGLERDLPLCPISDELYIGTFVLFGDVELTEINKKRKNRLGEAVLFTKNTIL